MNSFINKNLKSCLRIAALLVVVLVVLAVVARVPFNKPLCKNCNVILVSIDTLSALHLPCYGYERNTAPNLCAFAKKSTLFTNSFSQSSITLESHLSIFTSLYSHTHKLTEILGDDILDEKYETITQLLRSNGYNTIYHGVTTDFHLPLNRGFERGFDIIEPNSDIETWKDAYPKLLKNAEEKKPTFLFLHTYATHAPYITDHKDKHLFTDQPEYPNIPLNPKEYYKLSLDFFSFAADNIINSAFKGSGGEVFVKKQQESINIAKKLKVEKNFEKAMKLFNLLPYDLQGVTIHTWYLYNINHKNPQEIEYFKALYDERIYQMDQEFKKLLDLLEDPRLSKNTILIITSDHGEEFMEHGSITHGINLYHTSTRVPLIIHIPGVKAQRIDGLVQGIDIYPTIANLIGVRVRSYIEGLDLTGLIKGEKNAAMNSYVLSEFNHTVSIQKGNMRFYYNGRLGNNTFKPINELYDLSNDPQEKNNIVLSNPEKVEEFFKLLKLKK